MPSGYRMTNSDIVRMGSAIFKSVKNTPVPIEELWDKVSEYGTRRVFGKFIAKSCRVRGGVFDKVGDSVVRRGPGPRFFDI